jgi:glycerophosphoryl diester phosphodiesterase
MMQKLLILTFLVFALFSCKKQDYQVSNLNNNRISVLGHAGMGLGDVYPMNSLESLHKCLNLGTDGVEFDVQMSRDSVLVLFHDRDLSTATNLSGSIHEHTWNELRQARYSQTPYLDYSLISMDEFFHSIENHLHSYVFTVDCKLYPAHSETSYPSTFSKALSAIIEKHQLEDQVCIESQDIEFLKKLKQLNPVCKLFIYPANFESGFQTARREGLYGITISTEDINKEQVSQAHLHQLRVAVWNTHSNKANEDAIRKNPDYIQTDKVAHLIKLLK